MRIRPLVLFFALLLPLGGSAPGAAADDPPPAEASSQPAPAESATRAPSAPEGATGEPPAATPREGEAATPSPHSAAPPPVEDVPLEDADGNPIEKDPDFAGELDDAEERQLELPNIPKEVFAKTLRDLVGKAREKVIPKLEAKIEAKTEKTSDRIAVGLGLFSLCGVFLLFLPLYYNRKYPGQIGKLFKYSALAAGVFFVAVNLFAALLVAMNHVKGAVAAETDPSIAVFNAALDTMDEKAEKMIDFGGVVIKPTLDQLASGDTDDPMPVALMDNAARAGASLTSTAKDLAPTILRLGKFAKESMWIMEYVPVILTLLVVVLFILGARPLLKEIIELPARAARGEQGAGAATMKSVMRRVYREFFVTGILAAILFVLTIVAGVAMRIAVRPAVEALIDYLLATMLYIQQPGASGTLLLASLGGCIFFIVLTVAVVIVGNAFFLGKTQKVLQSMFHDGVSLKTHARWWKWSVPSVLLVFALPIAWVYVAYDLVDGPLKSACSNADRISSWDMFMLSGPLLFIVGFVVVFWAARGFKGLGFMRKYPPLPVAQ